MAELYSLPDGWEWKTLSDIFNIERGGSPRPIKDYITYDEDGINWIKISDATKGDGKYIESTEQKIKPSGLKNTRLVVDGDFIMSNSMSFGKPYIVKTKGAIHDGWLLMREKIEKTDKDFFYYLLSSNYMYEQFSSKASGTTVKNLNIDMVKTTNIPLPPFEEQKRIVVNLDNLFAKIDKAIALHQKNIDEANIFMASVLNDVFVELEEKYSSKTVYELCTKITDGTHSTPKYIDSGIPFLSVKNISQGVISFDDTKFISIEEHNLLSKRCNVEKNDILYTKVGTTGIAKVVDTDIEFSIFVSIALLKPKKDLISSMYFQHILNSPNCYEQSQSRTRGVANRNLVLNDIKQIFFPLPPLKTQQKVVAYLDEISNKMEKIKNLQKEKMQSLKALKASILDQAFKGEL